MVYQTYRTNAEKPYASGYVPEGRWIPGNGPNPGEAELEQLRTQYINYPVAQDETQGLVNNPTYIDNDDEWEDTAEHLDSGIRDIMITGTVRLEFSP